jgi:hypothetical protein
MAKVGLQGARVGALVRKLKAACKIAHLDRDLMCPKKKSPSGGWGLGGLGLLIFETKVIP